MLVYAKYGVHLTGDSDDNVVYSNTLSNIPNTAVYLEGSSSAEISNNMLVDTMDGVHLDGDSDDSVVFNNTLSEISR